MSFLRHNLGPRLRLMRTALFRRFIYTDVIRMAEDYGLSYRDLCANVEPIEFVRTLVDGTATAPPDFRALIEPAETFTPPGAPGTFSSEPSVGRFLGQLAYYLQAQTVVELGCFVGWSSAHLALGIKASGSGGRLYCVDFRQDYLDTTMANLERHGLAGVATPVLGQSLELPVIDALPQKIDMVFLDTSHSYPATRDEILAYAPRLGSGGLLVLHDSTRASGVRRSIGELSEGFDALTFGTERSNGVTVLRARRSTS
jgi:predicted O-methyltransferase YrrM